MPITDIMGKPLKHHAINKETKERYVLLALENDTDKDTCSVVDIDALDSELRSELVMMIDSDDCQRVTDPWKVLDTKFFMSYPKQSALAILRALKRIQVVKSENVLVEMPDGKSKTPKEIADDIRIYKEKSKGKKDLSEDFVERTVVDVDKLTEAENKNSQDIAELRNQMTSISKDLKSLIAALQGNK